MSDTEPTRDDEFHAQIVARGRTRAILLVVVALVLVVLALLLAVEPTAAPDWWSQFADEPFDARKLLRWPYRAIMVTDRIWIPLDLFLWLGGSMIVLAVVLDRLWPRLAPRSVGGEALLVFFGLGVCVTIVSLLSIAPGLRLVGAFLLLIVAGGTYGVAELMVGIVRRTAA